LCVVGDSAGFVKDDKTILSCAKKSLLEKPWTLEFTCGRFLSLSVKTPSDFFEDLIDANSLIYALIS
jgi:hypothetical protein